MSYLVLGGNGQQGRAIVRYLALHGNAEVHSVDLALPIKDIEISEVNYWTGDAYSLLEKKNFLKDKIVISCLRPEFTSELVATCKVNHAKGWIDMGGDDQATDKLRKHDYSTGRKGMTVVTDCGLAPGIASSIAGKAAKEGENYVSIYCGGLPLEGARYGYALSFHPEGLLGEYTGTTKCIENYKTTKIPTLMNPIKVTYNEMILEAAPTSGGLSFTPDILNNKLKYLHYYTLRFPGHWEFLKDNILWRDKEDAVKVIGDIFSKVSKECPDMILLGYRFRPEEIKWYKWVYDIENDISAMAQATGYTVGAVATMINDNSLPTGLVGMHDIDLDEIISRVRKIPGQFKEI